MINLFLMKEIKTMRRNSTITAERPGWMRRIRRSNRGVAAIEFALIVPILLILMLGLIDYGLAMFTKMELTGAVRAGAQLALSDKDDIDKIKQAVVDATNNAIPLASVSAVQTCKCDDETTVTCGDDCGDSSDNRYFMTITASQVFSYIFLTTPVTLVETAIIRTK